MEVSILQVFKYICYDWHQFNHFKQLWVISNREKYRRVIDEIEKIPELNLENKRLDDISFTVFDIETTGFFPRIGDEVVSIGAIKTNLQHIQFPEHFYEVIKPIKSPSKDIQELIGLTERKISEGKPFPFGFLNFIEFSRNTVLVAHPASFDVHFLKEMARRWGLPNYNPYYIDSYEIANFLYPNMQNNLDSLVQRFEIEEKVRHHALNDAHMTARVFHYLVEKLNDEGIYTLGQYIKANRHHN